MAFSKITNWLHELVAGTLAKASDVMDNYNQIKNALNSISNDLDNTIDNTTGDITTDNINEKTDKHGVIIDGVTLKDSNVSADDITASGDIQGDNISATNVTATNVTVTNNVTAPNVKADYIKEKTSGAGLDVDGVILKDGNVIADTIYADKLEVDTGANIPFMGGFKNKFINGDFRIWQRGTSFSSNGYTADRWKVEFGGASSSSVTKKSFTVGQTDVPNEPQFYLEMTVGSSATSYSYIGQLIENVRTFAGRKITFSFYAKADSNLTLYINAGQWFGDTSSGYSGYNIIHNHVNNPLSVQITTSWQKFEYTINVPSIAGKVIDDDTSYFNLGIISASPSPSYTLDLALMQVEEGEYATDFEVRPIGIEEILCKRYGERILNRLILAGDTSGGNTETRGVIYYIRKRTIPTIVLNISLVESDFANIAVSINSIDEIREDNARLTISYTNEIDKLLIYDIFINAEL